MCVYVYNISLFFSGLLSHILGNVIIWLWSETSFLIWAILSPPTPCPPSFQYVWDPSYSTAAAARSLQPCPTLCNPVNSSLPGSSILGILRTRTLEWVAISFSNAWKWKWKWSRSVMSDSSQPHRLQPTRLLRPWEFPGKSTGVGCHCLLCPATLAWV